MIPFVVLVIFVLWIGLSLFSSIVALEALLQFFQMTSRIQGFGIAYPSVLAKYAVPLTLFNFDIDFVSPVCALPYMQPGDEFLFVWPLP